MYLANVEVSVFVEINVKFLLILSKKKMLAVLRKVSHNMKLCWIYDNLSCFRYDIFL